MTVQNPTCLPGEVHLDVKYDMPSHCLLADRDTLGVLKYLKGDANINHLLIDRFAPKNISILDIKLSSMIQAGRNFGPIFVGQSTDSGLA